MSVAGEAGMCCGEQRPRIVTFDVAKALVMLLVVGGHLQGNGIVANTNEWIDPYYGNFTVGVDMPLFFMISGYFSANSLQNGSWGKVIARTIGFVWPVIMFGAIFGAIIYLTGTKPLWKVLLYPAARVAFADWFLLTIAIIYLSCALIMRVCKTTPQMVILFGALYIALIFAPRQLPFHWTSNVMHMFPYFAFGVFALRRYKLYKKAFLAIPAGLLFLITVLLEGDATTNGMSFYTVETDWHTFISDWHIFLCFWARTVVGISGSLFILWGLDKLCSSSRFKFLGNVAIFGTTTLGVYVMHQWPLVQVRDFELMPAPLLGQWKWPVALLVFLVCHLITLALRRSTVLNFVFFGNEKWLSCYIDRLICKRYVSKS